MDPQIRDLFIQQYENNWYLTSRAAVLAAVLNPICRRDSVCRVVEVGAGIGSILSRLDLRDAAVGVEGVWELANVGRTRYGLRFLVGDIEKGLPLSDASADVVLALDVLEHLDDDRAAAVEMRRILRPAGTLVATVPAFQSLWSRHDVLHHHKRRYSRRQVLDLLASTGFRCTRITYFNTVLFPLVYVSRTFERFGRGPYGSVTDYEKAPWLAGVLGRAFQLEGPVVSRWNLPIGVSLLAVATRP